MAIKTPTGGLSGLLLAIAAGVCLPSVTLADSLSEQPDTIVLSGVFRDFRSSNIKKGGHPDFDPPTLPNGRGLYMGMAKDQLNGINEPDPGATTGHKVTTSSKDSQGRNIIGPKPYIAAKAGDTAPAMSATDDKGAVSTDTFAQWFNETPAAMSSQTVSITLTRSGSLYGFDAEPRKEFVKTMGDGANKNWGYTFEVGCDFYFDSSRNDTIVCGADDAMWVYINGKLVIDLGGCHDYMEQVFEVNRLAGLVNGQKYQMKVFYAERQKNNSWMKFQTSLTPTPLQPPAVSGRYD